MTAAVAALLLLVLTLLELWLGNWRLQLPLVADLVFYLTVACSWRVGLGAAVVGGVILDALWGGGCVLAPSLCLLAPAARLWARGGLASPLPMNMLAGLAIPFFMLIFTSIFRLSAGGGALPVLSAEGWSGALLAGAVNSWALYLLIVLADKLAAAVGVPDFASDAARRRRESDDE